MIVGLDLASVHAEPHYRDYNPGIYFVLDSGWSAGTYINSVDSHARWGGFTFSEGRWSVTVGAVYGYPVKARANPLLPGEMGPPTFTKAHQQLLPLIVPSVSIFDTVRIGIMPAPAGASALHLSVEHKF